MCLLLLSWVIQWATGSHGNMTIITYTGTVKAVVATSLRLPLRGIKQTYVRQSSGQKRACLLFAYRRCFDTGFALPRCRRILGRITVTSSSSVSIHFIAHGTTVREMAGIDIDTHCDWLIPDHCKPNQRKRYGFQWHGDWWQYD